jgi:phosphoglucosamine mutase
MRKLFGTDGIRGVAGEYPLNRATVQAVGRALGAHLAISTQPPRVLIGRDTRESGTWIEDALAAGLSAAGVTVERAGVMPTPGVAYLARLDGYAAGAVISASHNPWRDNGIKIFGHDGYKLADEVELAIEQAIFADLKTNGGAAPAPGKPQHRELTRDYVSWLVTQCPTDPSGLKLVVDCANGAASEIAPQVFRAIGAQAVFIHASPDGKNINEGCGALHPDVAKATVEAGADVGITFDGDADRALFCDARGRVVNGDAVLLIAARDMKSRGTLAGDTVVATTMSNVGLEVALQESGIKMLRAAVGDKYVLEEMRRSGAALGGEQSGHIIFGDGQATTGDGLLTALRMLQVMAASGKSLAELTADMKVFPQVIRNVRVREKKPFEEMADVRALVAHAERHLCRFGRVNVRYSGTEKLARVMVEADCEDKVIALADAIAAAIQREVGE